jgi:simple sugar transport system ATP-binding protein
MRVTATVAAPTLLETRGVCKAYKGVQALRDVSLTIQRGEIHALVGENGSGKSTLIKIIAGVVEPDSGEILFDGRRWSGGLDALGAIRAGIQVIYQDLSLLPNLTVAENVALSQVVEKGRQLINWATMQQVAATELRSIHAEVDLDAVVEDLPVSSRQLVAIARALTQGAKLIIMDEPTTALTRPEVDALVAVIEKLRARGISTLFVSHKLDEVLRISDRVTVIRDGKPVGVFAGRELTTSQLEAHMTGKPVVRQRFETAADTSGPPLLELRGMSREGHFSDINLRLWRGEILGITGLLGSGRSELALSIFGMNPADSGEVLLDARPVTIRSTEDAVRHRIAYLPEDRVLQGLFQSKSIGENLVVTILDRLRGGLGLISAGRERASVTRWVEQLKIKTASSALPVTSLSGGNQQKVVIGKWLAIQPQLFILDNPTVGIDVASKAYIHQIVRDLARSQMGVILISDEIAEVLGNCNRVLVMKEGRVVREVRSTEITEEELYGFVSGNAS